MRRLLALIALLAFAVAAPRRTPSAPRHAKRLKALHLLQPAGGLRGASRRRVPPGPPATPRPIFPGREDAPNAPLPVSGEAPDAGDDSGGDDVSGTNNQEAGRPRARHGQDRR